MKIDKNMNKITKKKTFLRLFIDTYSFELAVVGILLGIIGMLFLLADVNRKFLENPFAGEEYFLAVGEILSLLLILYILYTIITNIRVVIANIKILSRCTRLPLTEKEMELCNISTKKDLDENIAYWFYFLLKGISFPESKIDYKYDLNYYPPVMKSILGVIDYSFDAFLENLYTLNRGYGEKIYYHYKLKNTLTDEDIIDLTQIIKDTSIDGEIITIQKIEKLIHQSFIKY